MPKTWTKRHSASLKSATGLDVPKGSAIVVELRNGRKLGELHIGAGSIGWKAFHAKAVTRISHARFAEMMSKS